MEFSGIFNPKLWKTSIDFITVFYLIFDSSHLMGLHSNQNYCNYQNRKLVLFFLKATYRKTLSVSS